MKYVVLLLSLLCPLIAYSGTEDDQSYAAIAARLMPEGIIDILGQNNIRVTTPIDAARPERGGNEIVNEYCIVCHGTGTAGSPKLGCASAWLPRKAKGFALLLQHAQNGFHFMPAKGTCLDCSQGELEEAIRYMINHSTGNDSACNQSV